MSTRCLIGYLDREPGVRDDVIFSYCHFDGYPSGVGKTLVEYYNTPELALKVSSLHGFSSLKKTYEETKAQEYTDGFGYGKMTYDEYNRTDNYGADYVYMYRPTMDNKGGSWSVRRTFGYDINYLIEENILDKF